MKILYSCLSKSWGGMEMVTLTGIKQLLKNNIKVELLCLTDSRLQIEANNLGIIIHSIRVGNTFSPLSILKTYSIIKSGNYDLIHSHASKDLWLIVPVLKILKSNVPLVFTKHVGSYILKKDFLHNNIYSRVNLAIAISTVIKNNLIKTTSLIEDEIKIVFNGVDLIKFNPDKADKEKLRNELDFADNDIIIGMTGRFSPGKGHEEFLFTANELNKKYTNLKFVIVGEASRGEDEYAKSIKQQAENYGITCIYFLGFRNDIPDVLASLDVFVFPSHAEAFGIALIEAMAMEKPSVCSDSDGVLDIAINDKTGYLFKVKDGKDLSIKLEKLILDSNKRRAFGLNARKRVEDIFEIEKITNQTIKHYSELIEIKK
ncbi:MAG: glycosyltransferase family 4 protein [Ignavibacteriaceae bacterium]